MTRSTGSNWLGVPSLAKELGVTLRTAYAILDTGDIPCYRIRRGNGSAWPHLLLEGGPARSRTLMMAQSLLVVLLPQSKGVAFHEVEKLAEPYGLA